MMRYLRLSGSLDMSLADRVLECLHKCEIPYDEREVILDRAAGQILVPVKMMVTETHLTCLKNRLPARVTDIELGSPTAQEV